MKTAPLFTSRDIPALWHLGLFFGGLGLLYLALHLAKGIWIYILAALEFGFFIGAGIGLSTFGGNALGMVGPYARDNQDWIAFLTGGAWGAGAAGVLALIVAGALHAGGRYRPRATQAASTLPPASPPPPRYAASKAVDRLARDLDVTLGEKLDVSKLPLLVPEQPDEPPVPWETIDYMALEMAPLYGQFARACITSWEKGKPPVIDYPRGLVIQSSELRLYLRHRRN
jgi:hypothetical protein